MFELKPLSADSIPRALEKAERYRLLNEPLEAESICCDVLRIDSDNQQALVMLILALTEQFDDGIGEYPRKARELVPRLRSQYEQVYYRGLIAERRGKTLLRVGGPAAHAEGHESVREAMTHFAEAESLRPPGNDDALLRWNACARLLMRDHADEPAVVGERFDPLLE
jgi:hypothetical protein